jgi:hypothetical protein
MAFTGDQHGKNAVAQAQAQAAADKAQMEAYWAMRQRQDELTDKYGPNMSPQPPVPPGVDPNSPGYGPRVPR